MHWNSVNKIGLTINSVVILATIMFFSGCASTSKTAVSLGPEVAKISYRAYRAGTLFLADQTKCSSLFGLSYNEREVTPIVRSSLKLDIDHSVTVPVSDNHIFLATTDTLLDDKTLKFWFRFPVKTNKSYKVYIQKTEVDKKLFNLERYKYNKYEYRVGVIDELGQAINIEDIPSPNLDAGCKSKIDA